MRQHNTIIHTREQWAITFSNLASNNLLWITSNSLTRSDATSHYCLDQDCSAAACDPYELLLDAVTATGQDSPNARRLLDTLDQQHMAQQRTQTCSI